MSFWFRDPASQNKMGRNTVDTQKQSQAYTNMNRSIPPTQQYTNTQTHTQTTSKKRKEGKEGREALGLIVTDVRMA